MTSDLKNLTDDIITYRGDVSRGGQGNLNFLYINIRSMRRKIDDLKNLIDALNFDVHVVVLTETWIYKNLIDFYNLTGYDAFHSCREGNRGGGSCIFVQNNIPTTTEFELMTLIF